MPLLLLLLCFMASSRCSWLKGQAYKNKKVPRDGRAGKTIVRWRSKQVLLSMIVEIQKYQLKVQT